MEPVVVYVVLMEGLLQPPTFDTRAAARDWIKQKAFLLGAKPEVFHIRRATIKVFES